MDVGIDTDVDTYAETDEDTDADIDIDTDTQTQICEYRSATKDADEAVDRIYREALAYL